jgi:hypothetical protein
LRALAENEDFAMSNDGWNDGFTTQGTALENPLATGAERRGQEMAERMSRRSSEPVHYDWISTVGVGGVLLALAIIIAVAANL